MLGRRLRTSSIEGPGLLSRWLWLSSTGSDERLLRRLDSERIWANEVTLRGRSDPPVGRVGETGLTDEDIRLPKRWSGDGALWVEAADDLPLASILSASPIPMEVDNR